MRIYPEKEKFSIYYSLDAESESEVRLWQTNLINVFYLAFLCQLNNISYLGNPK